MHDAQSQGSHLYVLTLFDGQGQGTLSGTITPPAGATRFDVLDHLRRQAGSTYPSLNNGAVVFFLLEPNTL
ncbi:hypothetical protein ACFWF9_06815 [Streptomyces roseolus]|uniref:hypothetical protein n=1 Tax=Streptomyces roseolus TaxID=67358 RepID=UPI0036469C09